MTERNAGAARPHDSKDASDCKEPSDSIEHDEPTVRDRLEAAAKQLRLARRHDEIGEWDLEAIHALEADLAGLLYCHADVDRGNGIETDGGRDSPKGALRITLDRDDLQHLLKTGTSVVEKDVGPITVNIRCPQRLEPVVMLAGRNKDPEPERVDDDVDRGDGVETDGGRVSTEDLTDEQIERVLNSKGFQKMLAYSKLADGIDVLESEDEIFDSMVNTITKQHSSVSTESSIREVLNLFRTEVSTFTEPLVDDDGEGMESDDLEEIYVDEADR